MSCDQQQTWCPFLDKSLENAKTYFRRQKSWSSLRCSTGNCNFERHKRKRFNLYCFMTLFLYKKKELLEELKLLALIPMIQNNQEAPFKMRRVMNKNYSNNVIEKIDLIIRDFYGYPNGFYFVFFRTNFFYSLYINFVYVLLSIRIKFLQKFQR